MRDKKRIELILNEIGFYWKRNPDLRLGQILSNMSVEAGMSSDPFYLEDDRLLNVLIKENELIIGREKKHE